LTRFCNLRRSLLFSASLVSNEFCRRNRHCRRLPQD
jgi:hypothetical protein